MFASCEQIDHFGGSFRGSQARANPVKDIWATLEGAISQRRHSVCLPRCTCHIRLPSQGKTPPSDSFLKRLLLFVCSKVPRSLTLPLTEAVAVFPLSFQGVAHDAARIPDGVEHIAQPCATGVDGRSREPFSPLRCSGRPRRSRLKQSRRGCHGLLT